MARARIKGSLVTFKFGTPSKDYKCDLISAVLERTDQGGGGGDSAITFCDAATGAASGEKWTLTVEALQSTDDSTATDGESLHSLIWESAAKAGGDKIPFEFAPHGNGTATAAQPHYTGTAVVPAGGYPAIGGQAGTNSWTWSYTFDLDPDVITKVIA